MLGVWMPVWKEFTRTNGSESLRPQNGPGMSEANTCSISANNLGQSSLPGPEGFFLQKGFRPR